MYNDGTENYKGFIPLVVDHIYTLTPGFKSFIFTPASPIAYEPGQFITLVDLSTGREIRRSYSIVSSPALHEPLTIAVKRVDNGFFSRKLFDNVQTGDTLYTTGAAGFYRLPENVRSFNTVFFFAAGSGIAPVFSLLKTLLHGYADINIILVYSNTSLQQTAYYEELRNWQRNYNSRLTVHFLHSSNHDLRKARLNRDLMLELLAANKYDKSTTLFYTCGPDVYMRMIHFFLIEEGFPAAHIKKEDFTPRPANAVKRLPPDQESYFADVRLHGTQYRFPVHYPDSILQAARKIKLNLPYSCETGSCGSCAALCVSGNVWMSNNEVLLKAEIDRGLVLTCTGHPQHGPVMLDID